MSFSRKAANFEQDLDLGHQFENLLEEARTIMPGIQALFGFQLIAVFSDGFGRQLDWHEQIWHLAATGLSALAAGLATFPAALHRQACPKKVTSRLVGFATWSLASALAPLALAISIDFQLLAEVVLGNHDLAVVLGVCLLTVLLSLWYLLPFLLRERVMENAEPCLKEPSPSNAGSEKMETEFRRSA